jgi:hypothetical protein
MINKSKKKNISLIFIGFSMVIRGLIITVVMETELLFYSVAVTNTSTTFLNYFSNLYGNMETPSIMRIIGHVAESSFLLYIDRARIIDITVLNAMKMTNTKQ